MPTVNEINPSIDQTVRIFDQFYNYSANVREATQPFILARGLAGVADAAPVEDQRVVRFEQALRRPEVREHGLHLVGLFVAGQAEATRHAPRLRTAT